MSALARRAVACKGWRWLPGMLTLDGLRLGGVAHTPSGAWSCVTAAGEPSDRPMRDELPDLTDPATLGCVLALVRDAWGDVEFHITYSPCNEWWVVYMGDLPDRTQWTVSQAEALVAALEAAP